VQTVAKRKRQLRPGCRNKGYYFSFPLVHEFAAGVIAKESCDAIFQLLRLRPNGSNRQRSAMRVYRTNGVFRIGQHAPAKRSGFRRTNRSLRTVITQDVPWMEHPFLRSDNDADSWWSLDGVEGILLSHKPDRTLIISVDAIQALLAVRVEGYDVEGLKIDPAMA